MRQAMPLSRLKAAIISSHCGTRSVQAAPEVLGAAPVEIGERDALLLHPGEVAEIEDALALARRGIEHVLGAGADEMPADDLGRHLGRQLARVVPALADSAASSLRYISWPSVADRDDHVVGARARACLAILMAPRMLAIEERPKWRSARTSSGATPSRRAR